MPNSSARLIELLELLQSRRSWTGTELASRLGVSTRTLRNNVAQLRELGFPVTGTTGVAGGYELGAGARMAPLLLEDDEAVAVAVGLRTAANAGIHGIEEASVRALAKLGQVLPEKLRGTVEALQGTIEPLRWGLQRDLVSPEALTVFSQACRDSVQVRFDYVDATGASTQREVEPHTLVPDGRRWYLVAFDPDRMDWRTFRVDRTQRARLARRGFRRRPLPAADAATFVRERLHRQRSSHEVSVRLHTDLATATETFGPAVGELSAEGDTTRLDATVESLEWLALRLAMSAIEFTVIAPEELRTTIADLAARLDRGAAPT